MILKKKICDGCHQETYIYKNVTTDGIRYKLCKECAFKKQARLTPNRAQIKKVSDKKKTMDVMYTKLRKIQLEQFPTCQINTEHCSTVSTEIHHSAGRLGENYLGVNTWFATCRECHTWVHLNPKTARENGWLK
jgi:hypothetical protein